MRVLVKVSPPANDRREVDVRLEVGGKQLSSHSMVALEKSPWVAPCELNLPAPTAVHAGLTREGDELGHLMKRFESDELDPGDVLLIGRYLFDCLLGQTTWTKILAEARDAGAKVIHLALSWPSGEYDLQRLSWEAMHDGSHFLGAHPDLAVAVVRVVEDAPCAKPEPTPAPAKVLFAVGVGLDDPGIRPGAEVIGLIQGAERGGVPIDSVIVDNLTRTRLTEVCARFKPDIVHFVSHGSLAADGRGQIQLQRDEADQTPDVNGTKLLEAMGTAGELPSLVVLTGCDTAAAGEHMDSLAAELVKGGIPTVVGMAGKIADPVCRLFTRKFGLALNEGEPLVEAMTHGRRAGLMEQERNPADDHAWVLPSIYLAPSVPCDHAPVDTTASSAIVDRIRNYDVRRKPVFCGRQELGQWFDKLIDDDHELQVLVAYERGKERLGKTRLLFEFATRALWAGHVVVIIDDRLGDPKKLPSNSVQLAAHLLEAIEKARRNFGIDDDDDGFEGELLAELIRVTGVDPELDGLEPARRKVAYQSFLSTCQRTKERGAELADTLSTALVLDLERLMADAGKLGDGTIDANSRPILILGGIGHWGNAAELLCRDLFGSHGLGTPKFPIPVFATCSLEDPAGTMLDEEAKRIMSQESIRYVELRAFDDDEGALAYLWVLLHPWSPYDYGELAYTPNCYLAHHGIWEGLFKNKFKGIPGHIESPDFYDLAHTLKEAKVFVGADDDDILAKYAEKH